MCAPVGAITVCAFEHNLCIYLFIHLFKCSLFNDTSSNSAYTAWRWQWIKKDKEGCTFVLTEGFILVFVWMEGQKLGNTSEHWCPTHDSNLARRECNMVVLPNESTFSVLGS